MLAIIGNEKGTCQPLNLVLNGAALILLGHRARREGAIEGPIATLLSINAMQYGDPCHPKEKAIPST
jgi:hypothetical protein